MTITCHFQTNGECDYQTVDWNFNYKNIVLYNRTTVKTIHLGNVTTSILNMFEVKTTGVGKWVAQLKPNTHSIHCCHRPIIFTKKFIVYKILQPPKRCM